MRPRRTILHRCLFLWLFALFFFTVSPSRREITRKAAMPRGRQFPIYQQHIHERSPSQFSEWMCAPLYSFCGDVTNKRPRTRNHALCWIWIPVRRSSRRLRGNITRLKLTSTQWLFHSVSTHVCPETFISSHPPSALSPPPPSTTWKWIMCERTWSFCAHWDIHACTVPALERAVIGQSREPVNWSCT